MIRAMKGTHHVGIGVQNYEVMKEFYAKTKKGVRSLQYRENINMQRGAKGKPAAG